MSVFYRSQRVGRDGRVFTMYKFRTLKNGVDRGSSFVNGEQYTRFGWILRKTKLDEVPQVWNVLRRECNVVGPRAEEARTIELLPQDIRAILLSRRPGLTSLASLHYFDEGQILEKSDNPHRDYWLKIKPNKIALDIFYIQNRDLLLDLWIVWKTAVKILKSLWITRI